LQSSSQLRVIRSRRRRPERDRRRWAV